MKSIHSIWHALVFGTVMFATLSMSQPVLAGLGDQKNIRTSICNTMRGVPEYSDIFGLSNKSTSRNMDVFCPIIRDLTGHKKPLSTLIVMGRDDNTAQNISCRLYYHHLNYMPWYPLRHQSSGNDQVRLDVFESEMNPGTAGYGSYHLYCVLPPRTAITSIWYAEGR